MGGETYQERSLIEYSGRKPTSSRTDVNGDRKKLGMASAQASDPPPANEGESRLTQSCLLLPFLPLEDPPIAVNVAQTSASKAITPRVEEMNAPHASIATTSEPKKKSKKRREVVFSQAIIAPISTFSEENVEHVVEPSSVLGKERKKLKKSLLDDANGVDEATLGAPSLQSSLNRMFSNNSSTVSASNGATMTGAARN